MIRASKGKPEYLIRGSTISGHPVKFGPFGGLFTVAVVWRLVGRSDLATITVEDVSLRKVDVPSARAIA